MEHLFSTVPGIITGVGLIIAGIVGGVLYITDIFAKRKRGLKDEESKDEDRLRSILQSTVDELEKKVNQQDSDIKYLTAEVGKLRQENKTLIEILQGRDKQTQQFYEEGFKAMKNASEILSIAKDIQTTVRDKNESINRLIGAVSENAKVILEAAKL